MADPGRCIFCDREIEPELDYRKVTGFERRRNQGGTNALRLRQTSDTWACRFCIDQEARGISAHQGALM